MDDRATDRLLAAVRADPVCEAILDRLPGLGLGEWWLTGGAVFQNAWNAVTGRPPGWGIDDYDVFYFDADTSWEAEDAVIRAAAAVCADLPRGGAELQVRNQARVHLWARGRFGEAAGGMRPLGSARAGIDSFVATTCSVGVTHGAGGDVVHAPHGLGDVFGLRLRPRRGSGLRGVYEAKAASYARRWPTLRVEAW